MNDSNYQDNRHDPSDDEVDPQLQALFASSHQPAGDAAFIERVMPQVDRIRRRKFAVRAILALIVATVAMPFQDWALALTQVMIVHWWNWKRGWWQSYWRRSIASGACSVSCCLCYAPHINVCLSRCSGLTVSIVRCKSRCAWPDDHA